MAIKVHGVAFSTCTQRILTALTELGVEYELVSINLAGGEHKSPAYLKLQPWGKVPVLEDDGFFVFESRAVSKYIAKKYAGQGTKLIPDETDLKGYALFEQACSIEVSYFNGPVEGIAFEKVFKGAKGLGEADEAKVAAYAAQLDGALAVYEGILAKQAYLGGNELTLADLFHVPYGTLVKKLGYSEIFDKYPHVSKWFASLEARESWKKVSGLAAGH